MNKTIVLATLVLVTILGLATPAQAECHPQCALGHDLEHTVEDLIAFVMGIPMGLVALAGAVLVSSTFVVRRLF